MAVHFVYRCHYNAPSEKHVRTFPEETVLDWVRSVWQPIADEDAALAHVKRVLGGIDPYSFVSLFTGIAEEHTPPPTDMSEVVAAFQQHLYVNEIDHGRHHVQLMTDDDELEMAIYLFDDHYRAKNPGTTDFLLLPDWQLPEGDASGKTPKLPKIDTVGLVGDGDGVTYFAGLAYYDSGTLTDLPDYNLVHRLPGLRVPDVARVLLVGAEDVEPESPLGVITAALGKVLRARGGDDAGFRAAIRKNIPDATNWNAYTDWLQERGGPPAGVELLARAMRLAPPDRDTMNRKASKDLVRVTPHMAQACKHVMRWGNDDLWHQWIFFDDRWVATHPGLAAGILRFGTRWDVL